ncbi:MAG: DHA2 family efflux MFS transporter permease subunit [Chloroflexota bacterium]
MAQNSSTRISSLPKLTPAQGNLILAATIIGAGMVYLDGTVVTVALPRIQSEFRASVSGLQWLIDSYILFLTIPILVAGSLSDRYGRRKLYNIGLIGFTLASIGCGMAANMNQLIVARIFQGISGGIMLPGSLAILNATFPPAMRGRTVGTWSAFTPITTAIGPLLGGWLVDNLSWRAAFYLNVPLAVATLYLSLRYIPESKSEKAPPGLDWLGAGLVTAALGSLIFGLIEGPRRGWTDPLVWLSMLTSLAGLIGFGIVETRTRHPLIPFSLFKHRAFSGITAVTLILYFAMSGVFFFFTLDLQQIQHFSATGAGLAFMPVILFLFLISRWAGSYADRFGPRLLLIVGPLVIAAGFFMYILPGVEANYWLTFLPATVIFGVGLGLTVAPLTTVALAAVPIHLSGLASGVSNAASRVATMLAVAMLGALMVLQFGASLGHRTQDLPLAEQDRRLLAAEALDLGDAQAPAQLSPELQAEVKSAIAHSFVDAFRLMMALCGGLALVSAGVAAATIGNRIVHHEAAEAARVGPEVILAGRGVPADRSLAVAKAREGVSS